MPVGLPKAGGSWWRGLTECGPLENGMANHFTILALRTPWTVWKDIMIGYWKRNSPGSVGAQYATGDQWRNNSRKNEGMVIEARSNAIKNNIAYEPGMLGPWIKANWKWSNKRWPCHGERAYTLPESTWLCRFLRVDCCGSLLTSVVSAVLVAAWTRSQWEYVHHRNCQRL